MRNQWVRSNLTQQIYKKAKLKLKVFLLCHTTGPWSFISETGIQVQEDFQSSRVDNQELTKQQADAMPLEIKKASPNLCGCLNFKYVQANTDRCSNRFRISIAGLSQDLALTCGKTNTKTD